MLLRPSVAHWAAVAHVGTATPGKQCARYCSQRVQGRRGGQQRRRRSLRITSSSAARRPLVCCVARPDSPLGNRGKCVGSWRIAAIWKEMLLRCGRSRAPAAVIRRWQSGTDGSGFSGLVRSRKAVKRFQAEPVPVEVVQAVLEDTRRSPSSFNVQPWKCVIVRNDGGRDALASAMVRQTAPRCPFSAERPPSGGADSACGAVGLLASGGRLGAAANCAFSQLAPAFGGLPTINDSQAWAFKNTMMAVQVCPGGSAVWEGGGGEAPAAVPSPPLLAAAAWRGVPSPSSFAHAFHPLHPCVGLGAGARTDFHAVGGCTGVRHFSDGRVRRSGGAGGCQRARALRGAGGGGHGPCPRGRLVRPAGERPVRDEPPVLRRVLPPGLAGRGRGQGRWGRARVAAGTVGAAPFRALFAAGTLRGDAREMSCLRECQPSGARSAASGNKGESPKAGSMEPTPRDSENSRPPASGGTSLPTRHQTIEGPGTPSVSRGRRWARGDGHRKQAVAFELTFGTDGTLTQRDLGPEFHGKIGFGPNQGPAANGPDLHSRHRRKQRKKKRWSTAALQVLTNGASMASVLSFAGFENAGLLSRSCKAVHEHLASEEGWFGVCTAMGHARGLYVPHAFTAGWKTLFWDLLWPARHKWCPDRAAESRDFKIQVAARFRPREGGAPSPTGCSGPDDVFLPLHQRLQLLRAGKIPAERLLENRAQDLEAAMSAQQLPPGVLQALAEARRTAVEARRARLGRRTRPAWEADAEADLEGEGEGESEGEGEGEGEGGGEDGGEGDGRILNWEPQIRADDAAFARSAAAQGGHDAVGSEDPANEDEASGEEGGAPPRRRVRVLGASEGDAFLYVPGAGVRAFHFSQCFPGHAVQGNVYERTAREAVVAALNGFNACVLCYGQTGSGKTHTMFGPEGAVEEAQRAAAAAAGTHEAALRKALGESECGLVTRALGEVLHAARGLDASEAFCGTGLRGADGVDTHVTVQYVQVYQERLTDLLSGRPVALRDAGPARGTSQFVLEGATEEAVGSLGDVVRLLARGEEHKRYAETAMNVRSSRAHTVLVATIRQRRVDGREAAVRSRLQMVDLAGSEQVKKSGVAGQRFAEAVGINRSLLALGRVISALVEGQSHVPYYESRLTQLLKGAVGGNSRTTAIITCSSQEVHGEETLSSLRFGERCATITNAARMATTTVSEAARAVEEAIAVCRRALDGHVRRGLTHLPIHHRLQDRYQQLLNRRAEIARELDAP